MRAKLIVLRGSTQAAQFELKLPAKLGRGRESTLTLPHPLISRQHCELYEQDRRLFVRDLGSLNGTRVNGERIESPQALSPGDVLTLGEVTLEVVPIGEPVRGSRAAQPSDEVFAADHLTDYDFGGGLSDPRLGDRGDEAAGEKPAP